MEWWHWWLVVNLVCWIGGWAILQTVLIETLARLIDSFYLSGIYPLINTLGWAIALPLAVGLVVAAPGLFVLPIWLNWLREGREP